MNKFRIFLIIKICLVLLVGISLFMQVEYSKNKAYKNATSIMGAYNLTEFKEFEPSEVFANVNEQMHKRENNSQELLAKSKKEKIMVTKY